MKPVGRTVLVAALVAATTLSAAARQTTTSRPAFDVVSIKPTSRDTPGLIKPSPQRIEIPNTTLMGLIRTAYSRFPFDAREIVGGPSWIDSDRFTVIATSAAPFKTAPDGFPTDLTAMMRTLIEDRFNVKVHEERRDMPHYALVLARPDRKTGQGLMSVPDECSQAIKELSGAKPAPRRPGPPPCSFGGPPGKLIATGVTIDAFANVLSRTVGRRVIDRTGIAGSFNIELTFDPSSANALGPPGANLGPPVRDDSAPSIFTALQEQLGLKLESTRGPVDVLVVDAADRPTPN